MAGSEAIINKIIADATESANAIVKESENKANETVNAAKKASIDYIEAEKAAISKECELVKSRRNTVAVLDSRKIELKAKQELIGECFTKAQKKILSMPREKYLEYISELLKNNAEDGDEVVLSKSEKIVTTEYIKALSEQLKIKLTVSKDTLDYEGGLVLRSSACDKNLTLSTSLRALREESEKSVADILFN